MRENGLLAVVVSRYFLDANNSAPREYIADRAHFLGAIRLPNTAFKKNALTEVTTDIVFLAKAKSGEQTDRAWVNVGEVADQETGQPITINQYYIDNPGQMAGRMAITSKMHRDTADLVAEPGIDLSNAIETRLAVLPINLYQANLLNDEALPQSIREDLVLPDTLKIGSYFVHPNGQLARRLPDILDKHDYQMVTPKNETAGKRIVGMIEIRDALRDLMSAEQRESSTDIDLQTKRNTLNKVYDKFIHNYGHISNQANRLAMSDDPQFPLIHALESDYDKGVTFEMARKNGVERRAPSASKAAIFNQRVMSAKRTVEHVETAKDALVVSMNECGRIDIPRMVQLSGKPEEELIKDLEGLIYHSPTRNEWETADQYLTGNVKGKLRAAEEASEQNPRYRENVVALRAVQPADIDAVDISIQLGSTWVPDKVVNEFVGHLLDDVDRRISYQPALGKWLVNISDGDRTTCTVTWGTEDYPANKLIDAVLTNKPIQVKVEVGKDENGNKIYRVDESKTAAANQKADEIKQAFLDWVWEDKTRRETLANIYNERFNTNIPARYDGSHLTLPGASLGITLRPHQKDAIWRGIQDGTALLDHVVGAGKTLACVGTIMESRRMGLLNKPMVVVPNHLLLQWKDEFYSLYPNANILVAEKSDFKKENRERLFSRIATGDWDAVIVAHSSFKKIGMPNETLKQILDEQIEDLTDAIQQLKSQLGDRLTIKEMEKARERMRERLERQADTGAKDQAVSFADLGVDALFVDEAHEFKNLWITTSLSRISGLGNLAGSEKAFDLFVKCRYLQQNHDGRGVFFATGTPISNTIAELYTMQRFLQYDDMKVRGIVHFDSWASTFGQVVTGWELDATGVNYKLNSRFSKFQNVPELTSMYRTFADVITTSDLQRQAEEMGMRFPLPKLKGGKPENVIVERSHIQAQFMGVQNVRLDDSGNPYLRSDGSAIKEWNRGSIIHRMENLPKDPSLDNPLKITNDARKAGLDYRLIEPGAPDFEGSKINVAVQNIHRIWQAWSEDKGAQLVFCDLSTPKLGKKTVSTLPSSEVDDTDDDLPAISMDDLLASGSKFSVYDDIKKKLVALGHPEHQVRFIHEAQTDLQKAKLFDEVNRGEVRVLIGSTAKMGAGMNVQKRLVALHHLDAPWRPSDLKQREGRIERQGNLFYARDPENFEIEIFRYATKQTYDSRMWQTIEYKAAGIEQFRKGDSLQRVIDDVASEAANAAEMKAAATGNPLIFLQVQLSAELKKLEAVYSNFKRNQYRLESRIDWLADTDKRADRAIGRLNKEIERREPAMPTGFRFEVNGRIFNEDKKEALLGEIGYAMKKAAEDKSASTEKPTIFEVGKYRGFDISVSNLRGNLQFSVSGSSTYQPENLRYWPDDKFSLSGFINRTDNFLDQFEHWRDQANKTRDKELRELEKAKLEKERPFSQMERLEYLRQDVRDVMTELKLMQADDDYVSQWKPRSRETDQQATPLERTKVRA
ncbi:hypothetical protein GCM10009425_40320 [Pseudomonas asuensis]|uniref:Helicase C-terminal domain-containing protein n=1 Tax=Pseudomonas asuensis TaxID=1825787 RepID=A0ABQ2H190_9PSED|nr:hypothetical protein GCM10009425_40320 [Pseudomonas asuensis]